MGQVMRYCLNKMGKNEFWNNKDYQEYRKKHGMHFSEELSVWASAHMINSDGTEHGWSVEDVKNAYKSLGYELKGNYTFGDVTYIANQIYADFGKCLKADTDAVKMAYALTVDPDGYDGMIFNRYTSDIMEQGVCVPWEKFI